jgi:Tol biopolymer transport system component
MRHVLCAFVGSALLCSASFAAKPPPAASNPQVAYLSGSGNSVKLMVADESGSGAHVLYSSSTGFRFDLAPRAQRQVAINGNDNTLRLLSYTVSSNGTLTASGPPVALTSTSGGTSIDFSPDGRRIAYMCCAGGGPKQLMVYDLDTQAATVWADVQFVWDVAFFRNGASIAYIEPAANNMYAIYEVNGPGATPRQIFSTLGDFNLDSARTNPDALVLNYRPNNTGPLIGLWRAPSQTETEGTFLIPNMTNRAINFFPTLNCNDTRLAYMSSTTPSGGQVFFIRNLTTNQDAVFSKTSNIQLQFWPTCS